METFRRIIWWTFGVLALGVYWAMWTLALTLSYFMHGRSTHPAIEAALITVGTVVAIVVWRSLRKPSLPSR